MRPVLVALWLVFSGCTLDSRVRGADGGIRDGARSGDAGPRVDGERPRGVPEDAPGQDCCELDLVAGEWADNGCWVPLPYVCEQTAR